MKKSTKKEISKSILTSMANKLASIGFEQDNYSHDDFYEFSKIIEETKLTVRFSIIGPSPYSMESSIFINYLKNSKILKDRLSTGNTAEANDDQFDVTIWKSISNQGKILDNFYIEYASEADTFSLNQIDNIIASIEEFATPRLDIEATINEFKKPRHTTWPGGLDSFMKFMISQYLITHDDDLLNYSCNKYRDVAGKLIPEARATLLIEKLKAAHIIPADITI